MVDHAGLFFVRAAAPPDRPEEASLFLGDDEAGVPLEIVGVELGDERLRVIHVMAMRDSYRACTRRRPSGGSEPAHRHRAGDHQGETPPDPHYEQRLTDQAEAGFDPATLTRRHAGRPSLSGRAGHSKRVDLRVDDQTYEAIQRIADQDHRRVSDVVRDAINRYLEAS